MPFEYQRPDTTTTLRDGLEEYYASRDDLALGRGMSDAAREFFRCHDATHVVFGCNTTLLEEGVVKLWSLFGTTAGFGLLRDYALPESKEIYETLEVPVIVRTTLRMTSLAPRVWFRCMQMNKRWPWHEFDAHASLPLKQIRRDFGIRVLDLEPR